MARERAGGDLSEIEFSVRSMVCDSCAEKIRQALATVPGIWIVKPKLWRKRVSVRYDASQIQPPEIKNVIVAAGYDAA
jgi:copper chaperone CopZ